MAEEARRVVDLLCHCGAEFRVKLRRRDADEQDVTCPSCGTNCHLDADQLRDFHEQIDEARLSPIAEAAKAADELLSRIVAEHRGSGSSHD